MALKPRDVQHFSQQTHKILRNVEHRGRHIIRFWNVSRTLQETKLKIKEIDLQSAQNIKTNLRFPLGFS